MKTAGVCAAVRLRRPRILLERTRIRQTGSTIGRRRRCQVSIPFPLEDQINFGGARRQRKSLVRDVACSRVARSRLHGLRDCVRSSASALESPADTDARGRPRQQSASALWDGLPPRAPPGGSSLSGPQPPRSPSPGLPPAAAAAPPSPPALLWRRAAHPLRGLAWPLRLELAPAPLLLTP